MTSVFVVSRETGAYSDASSEPIRAYSSEPAAQAFITACKGAAAYRSTWPQLRILDPDAVYGTEAEPYVSSDLDYRIDEVPVDSGPTIIEGTASEPARPSPADYAGPYSLAGRKAAAPDRGSAPGPGRYSTAEDPS